MPSAISFTLTDDAASILKRNTSVKNSIPDQPVSDDNITKAVIQMLTNIIVNQLISETLTPELRAQIEAVQAPLNAIRNLYATQSILQS